MTPTAISVLADYRTELASLPPEMLGHQDVQTTANYYLRRVSEATLRDAMEGRDYPAIPA